MKISCIIASVRKDIEPFLNSIISQNFPQSDFEIILVRPDIIEVPKKVKLIIDKNRGPASKRNTGFSNSCGDYICFFDDDTIIPENCLDNFFKLKNLLDNKVIIGGPNIGMKDQNFQEKLSDIIFRSFIGSGFRKKFRFSSSGYTDSKDLSFCNIAMSRKAFLDIGMMNKEFIYSEDYEFLSCAKLKGYRFFYSKKLFVYHKRRRFPLEHLKQVYNWGKYNALSSIKHKTFDKRADMMIVPVGSILILLSFFNKKIAKFLIFIISFFCFIIELFSENIYDSFIFILIFPFHIMAYIIGQLSVVFKKH